jgi:hypothetical protein
MKILAPHKEQDGWVYVRVSRTPQPDDMHLSYSDSAPSRRIISSRRVERAVETDDFLRLCAEEGIVAQRGGVGLAGGYIDEWVVRMPLSVRHGGLYFTGNTLREAYYRMHNSEAYHRYHAAIEKETA